MNIIIEHPFLYLLLPIVSIVMFFVIKELIKDYKYEHKHYHHTKSLY